VLTFQRPIELQGLLPSLLAQAAESDESVEILVVDNDPAGGAAAIVRSFPDEYVRYAHEATPGIAAARNRALDEAEGSDALLFIDDDERPVDGWLGAMLGLFRAERPAGVVGPVVSQYVEEPDPWVSGGGFFRRRRFPTGTMVDVAATNNLLLDLEGVRRRGIRFDVDFGLSGGSDTLFTRQLTGSGGRLVWCDEAVVFDIVPPERVTRSWVLRRYFRSGNSWSRTSVRLHRSRKGRLLERIKLTVIGLARVGVGTAGWAWGSITRSVPRHAGGLRTLNRGLGMVSGAWGYVYSEYERARS
jgi:succinoglycan biosynthesis protein ExoM